MRWTIVYSDGQQFTHADGAPEDAPGTGVLGIGQEEATVGVLAHSGEHFYVWDEEQYGGWYGLDYYGLAQYIARPGKKIIKMGESISTERFIDFLAALRENPLMPQKSARYPWERRS